MVQYLEIGEKDEYDMWANVVSEDSNFKFYLLFLKKKVKGLDQDSVILGANDLDFEVRVHSVNIYEFMIQNGLY